MAKEHLEFMTAEDVDGLIAQLADLIERIDSMKEDFFEATDEDMKALYKRSASRLVDKKYRLLAALKQALEGMIE